MSSIVKFELSKMRNVGIMSHPGATGDFENGFGIVSPTELPLVPTASGITFFRWHSPLGRPHEVAANEVRFFKAVHEALKAEDGKGLSTVVVFIAGNMYRKAEEALIIAEGVKDSIDKKICVVAYAYNIEPEIIRARKDGYINNILLANFGGNNEAKFMQFLGLPLSQHTYQASQMEFHALKELNLEYIRHYPKLFGSVALDPEKLYRTVPEIPSGHYQKVWDQRLGLA